MKIEEIEKYINFGSTGDICVYREILFPELPHLVESIYITGSYLITVEFDSLNEVDNGDGWRWQSSQLAISTVIEVLEKFMGEQIDNWENISRSGKLLYSDINLDADLSSQEEKN